MPVVTRAAKAKARDEARNRPTSIALLKLPLLVLESVIGQLHPLQLFKFSCLSKKALIAASIRKRPVQYFHWHFDNRKTIIIEASEQTRFQIVLVEVPRRGRPKKTNHNRALKEFEFDERHGEVIVRGYKYNGSKKRTLMAAVLEHLLKVFVPAKSECYIRDINSARESIQKEQMFTTVYADAMLRSRRDIDYLNNLNTEEISIRNPFDVDLNYNKPLRHKTWSINNAVERSRWLSLDSVLNMETANLYIENGGFTVEDAKAIVERWCNGGLRQLKKLVLEENVPFYEIPINFNTIRDFIEEKRAELERDGQILEVTLVDQFFSLTVSQR